MSNPKTIKAILIFASTFSFVVILLLCTLVATKEYRIDYKQEKPIIKEPLSLSALYTVGEDITEGVYRLEGHGELSYYQIHRYKLMTIDNDSIGRARYIELFNGDTISVYNVTMTPLEEVEPMGPVNSVYLDGMYAVGIDIQPGVYTISPMSDKHTGYYVISTLDEIVREEQIDEDVIVHLREGDYVVLSMTMIVIDTEKET